eukprot:TRINITY_DN1132_c0_g1_i1.p1 TRINITY_DN1132_c0_g1~~TRINITY_DN1132_c0_g1_i1.p1  ORF type:complete len:443 (+),score=64.90 TRINITY_DN1132_c0_g1_i1:122-1450(+)
MVRQLQDNREQKPKYNEGGELTEDNRNSTSTPSSPLNRLEQNIEEKVVDLKQSLDEVVGEQAVNDIVDYVLPRVERVFSTMNNQYSGFHAMKTEIRCCWQHGSWQWCRTVLGGGLMEAPNDEDSEWAFIWNCIYTLRFGPIIQLFLLSFGSIVFPPMGFFLLMFLWERSYISEICTHFAPNNEKQKERWVFVNGMCVDNNLGAANATQLSKIFQKQVGFFHNPTQGLLFDFFECLVGRTFNFQTPVSRRLTKCLTEFLGDSKYEKVVLVVHSQGGIIASNAMELLIKRKVDIHKLEVYTFGSAADEFAEVFDNETGKCYPYYEHFANEDDYIAKIGTLHWQLPGNVFSRKRDGHFMGEHYLPDFKRGLYKIYFGPKGAKSRLFSYIPENVNMSANEKAKQYNQSMRKSNSSNKVNIKAPNPANEQSSSANNIQHSPAYAAAR